MDTSIYYDIRKCKSTMPIEIIIGPRGCGKTYSVLDYMQESSSEDSKSNAGRDYIQLQLN